MHLLLSMCAFISQSDQPASWFNKQAQESIKLCQIGKAKEAMQLLDQMKDEAARQQKPELVLFVQWKRGYCQYALGDLTQAQETLKSARDKAPKSLRFLNLIYRELGEAYLDSGKVALAEPCLQVVLDCATGRGEIENPVRIDEAELVRVHLLKVRCQLGLGQFEAAQKDLAKLEVKIADAPQSDDWAGRFAQCQMLLSVLDRRNHNMIGSLRRLEEGRKKLQGSSTAANQNLRFSCSLSLASCYWLLARFPEADRQLDLAEKVSGATSAERNLGALMTARAGLLLEKSSFALDADPMAVGVLDDLVKADRLLTEALAHHGKADRGQNIFTAMANFQLSQVHGLRGLALAARGNADNAKQAFAEGQRLCDRALELFGTLLPADNDQVLEVRHKRAWLLLRLADPDNARKEAAEALSLFVKKHGNDDLDCGLFHHLLLEIEESAGNIQQATIHAQAHRRLVANGLVAFLAGLTAPEQIQFFRKWDDPGLHASLRLGLHHAAQDETLGDFSAEWLINGKAMVAEAMAQVRSHVRRGEKYGEFARALEKQAYLLYGDPGGDRNDVQQKLLSEEANKRNIAVKWQFAGNGRRWCSLRDVRKRLSAREIYVGIFSLRPEPTAARAYYAWVVAATGPVRIARLGDAVKIEKLINDLVDHQEQFATIRLNGERTAENDLRQKCLEPLSRLVLDPITKLADGKDRWIISPDHLLWNVPWAALILPESGKYAIESLSFRYVISGRELVEEPERNVATGAPLLLGDPDLNYAPKGVQGHFRTKNDPLYMPSGLPASRTECIAISAMMKQFLKREPRQVLGVMTKEMLLQLERPPQSIYLSTHSFARLPTPFQTDDPMLSCAIAFAGWNYLPDAKGNGTSLPGLMTAADVLGINLHGTELVVLASCQSGKGLLQYGQSPADLRHAFHLAGARTVVSSLWSVNDKSTMDLMLPFMETLCRQNGADEVDALRDSQLLMIAALRRHRNHAHPFYWAAFTLSGRK